MPGASFVLGETKVRPGAYARWENAGVVNVPTIRDGIGAILFQSNYGPIGAVTELRKYSDIERLFGTGGTVAALQQFFLGGGSIIKGIRLGSSTTKALVTLLDTTGSPVSVARFTAAQGGTLPNAGVGDWTVTIRDSLFDPSGTREAIFYAGTKILLNVTFPKTSGDEAAGVVDAVNASGTEWMVGLKLATGSGVLAATVNKAFAGGADPSSIVGSDYTAALDLLSPVTVDWNFLVVDTTSSSIQASVQTYLDQQILAGHHAIAFFGIGPDVAWATRITRVQSFNDFAVIAVIDGGIDGSGATIDGWKAAARAAGEMASVPYTRSVTGKVITDFVGLSEQLTEEQINQALSAGAFIFTTNGRGQVQIEDDLTTLTTLSEDLDGGWKSARRVRERFYAVDILSLIADDYKGQLDNDEIGRTVVLTAMQGELDRMVGAGALFEGAKVVMDPPVAGSDYVLISITADDKQSIKKFYLTFKFRLTPN